MAMYYESLDQTPELNKGMSITKFEKVRLSEVKIKFYFFANYTFQL